MFFFLVALIIAGLSNVGGSITKTRRLSIGIQSPHYQSPAVHRGLEAAVRDVNFVDGLLPAGYELGLINLTDPDEAICSRGGSNYAFLKYGLRGGVGLCAVVGGNWRATAATETCKDAIRYMAHSVRWWNVPLINVYPGLPVLYTDSFNSFYSVAPSTWLIHQAVVGLMRLYGWTHINVLAETTDENLKDSEDLLIQFRNYGITHLYFPFSHNLTSTHDLLKQIKKESYNIIFPLLEDATLFEFLRNDISQDFLWILPGTVYNNIEGGIANDVTIGNITHALDNSLSLRIRPHPELSHSSSLLLTERTRREVYDELTSRDLDDGLSAYSYDAVMAVSAMLNRTNGTWSSSMNTFFIGLTGNISFDINLAGLVEILHHRCSKDSCNSTVVASFNGEPNATKLRTPNWQGGSQPLDKPKEEIWKAPVGQFIGCCVALLLGMAVCVFLFIFTIKYRHTRVVRLSGPILSLLLASSAFLLFLSAIFNGFNGRYFSFSSRSTLSFCWLAVGVGSCSFVGIFSVVVMKTWRLQLISKQSATHSKNEWRRSSAIAQTLRKEKGAVVGVVVMLLLDIAIVIAWIVADPFYIVKLPVESFSQRKLVLEICLSSRPLLWLCCFAALSGILLLFAFYLSWDARSIHISFIASPKMLMLGILSTSGLTVAYFVLRVVVTDPGIQYVLVTMVTMCTATTVLVIEFTPKVYAVLFRRKTAATGLGGVRCRERASMSEHCILQSHDVIVLKRRNVYLKEIIQMMTDEKNISEATVNRVRQEIFDVEVVEEGSTNENYSSSNPTVDNRKRCGNVTFAEAQKSPTADDMAVRRSSLARVKCDPRLQGKLEKRRLESVTSWTESTV